MLKGGTTGLKVDLYTTHCPKCLVLEEKLKQKNIKYEEHTNVDEMIKLGYLTVPVLIVDAKEYSFGEAVQWVNSLEE